MLNVSLVIVAEGIFLKVSLPLQVSAKLPPLSAVSRSAPLTSSPWLHTWRQPWMVSTLNFARPCVRTQPAPKGRPSPVGETWCSTRLCWASLTLWFRGIVPEMARRLPRILRSNSSPVTTTVAPSTRTLTCTRTRIHTPTATATATATPNLLTCSAACSETPTWGHLRTASRRARWKGRGLSSITTICQSRSPTSPWSLVPVLQQPIRSVLKF